MFNIILYEPEIPPNTGNIIRLCANSGCSLHLIQPLGFKLEDKSMKRAGLDYHEYANVNIYKNLEEFYQNNHYQIYACSTKAKTIYSTAKFNPGDGLLFGPESRGLPPTVLDSFKEKNKIKIPMLPNNHNRSLNLANAVSIIMYEAWRQQNFIKGE